MSILFSLLIAEGILRLMYPQYNDLFVWQPNLQHTFHPDPEIFTGVQDSSLFSTDQHGIRNGYSDIDVTEEGDNDGIFGKRNFYLFVGGSTTECLYLHNDETWYEDVSWHANRHSDIGFRVIGSIGKSGCTSRENYLHLKYFVPQFKRINSVVVMCGLNDLMKRLSQDTLYENDFRFTPEVEDAYVKDIFLSNSKNKSWWRRTAVFHLLQSALHKSKPVKWENVQDDTGQIYTKWRSNRLNALSMLDTLPDLTSALNEYERNLNLMIDEAHKQKVEIIFINQAAIWKDSMPSYEKPMLWMGGKGNFQNQSGAEYYSPKALRRGLDLYNNRLRTVCLARNVIYVDIDSVLPRNLSVFYDDCHFNEEGARMVSKAVYYQIKHNQFLRREAMWNKDQTK